MPEHPVAPSVGVPAAPGAAGVNVDLHRAGTDEVVSPRFGWLHDRLTVTLLAALLVALFSVAVYLAVDVQKDIAENRSIGSDNYSWTIFQLETDYLRLINTFDHYLTMRAKDGGVSDEDFAELKQKFDIFYSRIGVAVASITNQLGGPALSQFTETLLKRRDEWAMRFDALAPEHRSADWMPLYRSLAGASGTIRGGVLGALDAIIEKRDRERSARLAGWEDYVRLIILMLALIAGGLLVTFYILRGLRQQQSDLLDRSRELAVQSVTDPLTGVFSRRILERLFPENKSPYDIALLSYDIDDFKRTNDLWGHTVGDALLRVVARTLDATKGPGAIAVRMGGEEFAVITDWPGWAAAKHLDERIRDSISAGDVTLCGTTVQCTVSGGIARLMPGDEIDSALRWADEAMRTAKRMGKNRSCFADEDFFAARMVGGQLVDAASVEAALENGEIQFFIQPIVSMSAGVLAGYETLIRWVTADGTIHAPPVFLQDYKKLVEYPDGFHHIETNICRVLKALPEDIGKFISLNLSLDFIYHEENLNRLIRLAERIRSEFSYRLVVELSEASASGELIQSHLQNQAESLTAQAVELALDDFGREASNIDRIADLPVSIVKLDKKLIDELDSNPRSEAAVAGLVTMMQRLGLRVVAEGVETVNQARKLFHMGVSEHQGFLYARPLPPEAMSERQPHIERLIQRDIRTQGR
ncbi:EAL domain-containing protein [Spiribacter insolitus]|uniref:GGDEF and EAL domain-containing protein n=1 Tax=Spiribacter insolitus TaxID=3122417 RepID=A0ABV3T662_9GAMM